MGRTRIRELAQRRSTLGVISPIAEPSLVESLALLGFDFIVLDLEHGISSDADCAVAIRSAHLAGISALARIPVSDTSRMSRILDAGADGIVLPRLRTEGEMSAVVQALHFPPLGRRGMAAAYVSSHGFAETDGAFLATLENDLLIVAQIEDREAIELLPQITAPSVGVLVVGVRDLSISLGVAGAYDAPEVLRAVEAVKRFAQETGRITGMVARSPQHAAQLGAATEPTMIFVALSAVLKHGSQAFIPKHGETDGGVRES